MIDRQHAPAPSLNRFVAVFALSSIVNSALASNIVAALIERRLTPSRAALIGGLFGVMQLPGRVLMTNKSFTPGPFRLLLVSFALQIAGLLALMADGVQAAMWLGVIVFACGAGLTTLARPYLVLHVYGAERAGRDQRRDCARPAIGARRRPGVCRRARERQPVMALRVCGAGRVTRGGHRRHPHRERP